MVMPNWNWVFFATWWVLLFTMALGGISAAPWVPSRRRERRIVAEGLEVRPGAKVYDLGAGDGSMLFAMAERHPDAQYIGYEIGLPPWFLGLLRKWFGGAKYRNVSLRYGDLFGKDVSDADVVFVYLLEKAYPKLQKKLARELKPDAKVLVEVWELPGMTPERVIREKNVLPVYVYSGAAFKDAA